MSEEYMQSEPLTAKGNALSDEKLVELYKSGDGDAFNELYARYKYVIIAASRYFYLSGGDKDDVLQEGLIGLFKAVDGYNGKSSFKSYAYLCIKHTVLTAVKSSLSNKNKPLRDYVSIYGTSSELNSLLGGDPEEKVIDDENSNEFMDMLGKKLSKFEKEVLGLYLDGLNYAQISETLNKSEKSIDNALQRIRKKISRMS